MEFRFQTTAGQLADLHRRLDATRAVDDVNDAEWSYGMRADYLRALLAYWRYSFDWPAACARINAFPNFLIDLDGLPIHFIHARSPHANATPLLIAHGWPGSIVEFLDLIPRLTEPERHGGRAEDAFHVVAPSLPGYGGSPAATASGMGPNAIAKRHARLMQQLGYARYIAQGGDWGSLITQYTAAHDRACIGLHITLVPPAVPKDIANPLELVKPHEQRWLANGQHYQKEGNGYYQLQRTRPQTAAFALNDSPAGLCAWIAEKFHYWTDCERDGVRDVRNAISWDALLTNISLYWFTNTIGSSMRLYREQALEQAQGLGWAPRVDTPAGIAVYPHEISATPKAWAERRFNLVHWFEADRGGHFAAMEQPEMFADDLRKFRRAVEKAA